MFAFFALRIPNQIRSLVMRVSRIAEIKLVATLKQKKHRQLFCDVITIFCKKNNIFFSKRI